MIKKIMMSLVLGASALSALGQYQLPNSDFESGFVQAYKSGITTRKEPLNWHGFPTMDGSFLNTSAGRSTTAKLVESSDVRSNSTSKKCVYILTSYVGGVLANGVMTSGRVYSGSMTPTDASENYNYSPGNTYSGNNNKNTNFNPAFKGMPDAMNVWVKFDAQDATQASSYPYASVKAVLHNKNRYQDPEAKDYSDVKIASAVDTEIGKKGYGTWQELNIPFVYNISESLVDKTPAYMLVSFSTNTQPGGGTNGDKLYIDDLEFVYNSELSSAEYNGSQITFNASNQATVNKSYKANLLTLKSNGIAAKIITDYNEETALLTITVQGDNISEDATNQHVYTIQFMRTIHVTEFAPVNVSGEAHVVLDRAFNAGWNTVCLPFAYTASEIAEGAEAQEFKAVNGNWLTFDAVEGQLEPNKPYLINVPEAVAAGKMFENKTIVVGVPASVSNGTFTFTGVYEQKDMNGLYGVATVNGETKVFQGGTNSLIKGTRAYFETTDKSITSLGVAFNGETTSISTILAPAAAKATGVYNLQGIKLNNTGSTAGLPAGLYIVNGQKVLVK